MIYIIAVGINEFADPSINSLKGCVKDAERLIHKFIEVATGDTITYTLLTDGQATYKNFSNVVSDVSKQITSDDTVIITFSSHGVRGNGTVTGVVFHDTIAWDWNIKKELNKLLSAKTVLWVTDTCHSEDNFKAIIDNGKTVKSIPYSTDLKSLRIGREKFADIQPNLIGLQSCRIDEFSYDTETGGVGTTALLDLIGVAYLDVLQDLWIEGVRETGTTNQTPIVSYADGVARSQFFASNGTDITTTPISAVSEADNRKFTIISDDYKRSKVGKILRFEIDRKNKQDRFTVGDFRLDGDLLCLSFEDKDRGLDSLNRKSLQAKIKKETAIPYGYYSFIVNMSPKFKRLMTLIDNVPAYIGIRTHRGRGIDQTEGCPLYAESVDAKGNVVPMSEEFEQDIIEMIQKSKYATITIK